MNILITGGNTVIPIDQVRAITNGFRGRTGTEIAIEALKCGHRVTLLTSQSAGVIGPQLPIPCPPTVQHALTLRRFRTYDDLAIAMEQEICSGKYEAIIHSAAVSDYRVARVRTDQETIKTDAKISSSHSRLILELVPTEKLIDKIRSDWKFGGKLVKFKLQVGISDEALIRIARRSLEVSGADLIVANCYEWFKERAYILDADGGCTGVPRTELPQELIRRLS